MGKLQQAFEKKDVQKDALGRLFSSPFVRGFYKNEKPAVDVKLVGSKYEQRRMTALINKIATASPTGRKILEDAAKDGYSFGFERQSNSYGFCDAEKKLIRLNPFTSDAKLVATLAHESRHAQQHLNSIPPNFCVFDVATELKLRRSTEADAQAAALQIALEIRAATKDDSVWKAFKKTDNTIAESVKEPSEQKSLDDIIADRDTTMRDAFKGWFKNYRMIDAYEKGYLYGYLSRIENMRDKKELLSYFADKPFDGHKSSAEIVATVCLSADGKSYLANDPHILDRDPEMCGLCKETRNMADNFFREREKLTGKPADTSYKNLPDRGSLFGALIASLSMTPMSLKTQSDKKAPPPALTAALNKLRQGR